MSDFHTPLIDDSTLKSLTAPKRTALLVIDPQVDFIAPHGLLARAGVDVSGTAAALNCTQQLINAGRHCGVLPFFIRVMTSKETDSAALQLLNHQRNGTQTDIGICRRDTIGADFFGVEPAAGEPIIDKLLYSAFAGTDLDQQLRSRNIDTVAVCGFTTECCVDSTVRDAFHRGFHVVIAHDACASHEPDLHVSTLRALAKNFAHLTKTRSLIAAWQGNSS